MALVPMVAAASWAERDGEEAAEGSRTRSTLSNWRNRVRGRAEEELQSHKSYKICLIKGELSRTADSETDLCCLLAF